MHWLVRPVTARLLFDPRVIIEDGVCKLADRSALAGSVATMDRLIRTMVQKAEIPLADVIRMVSETPAPHNGEYLTAKERLNVVRMPILLPSTET